MITNPNTLGVFETEIAEIAEVTALARRARLHGRRQSERHDGNHAAGDFGIDVLHINLHKTFTTPHGGGGPGSGPVAVKKILEPFLPYPVVGRKVGWHVTPSTTSGRNRSAR